MNAETIYHRQLDIIPLKNLQKAEVTVIGSGAVGSFTVFTLAKMGIGELNVYDHDTVEEHNLPNQLFAVTDVGKPKVQALYDICLYFHAVEIHCHHNRYIDQQLRGIVVVAVDSMDARLEIWQRVKYNAAIRLFIDSRMGAEVGRVIAINPTDPDDIALYENTMHTSADAFQARCTEKTIIYTVLGIASTICGKVKKHLCNQPHNKDLVIDFRQSLIIPQK